MKRNMKLIGLAACLISCTSLAVAQENPEPQERQQHEQRLPREVLNPEKIATQMTDQMQYLQPIITQYFIDNKSEIWLLFLIAHSKR